MPKFITKNKYIYIITGIIAVLILVAIDQWTKALCVANLKNSNDIILWDGVLRFKYLENNGAAFSMLKGQMTLFYILTPAICLVIATLYLKVINKPKFKALQLISVFLIAGAIGNYIDRISYKYVVDFIYFELIDFPIFNVADIYVTCSMIVLIFLMIFVYKEEDYEDITFFKKKAAKSEE